MKLDPTSTKLTIVRHGETNYNLKHLMNYNPSIDVHLTPHGITQAKALAEQLRDEPFDVIFVSELPRTHQTAHYINQYHHLPITIDQRLNDIANGFEGRTDSEFHTLRDASPDPFTYRYGNFESSQDVYRRTASFLSTLATSSYHNILIVTSRHNLRHFRHLLDHLDQRRSLNSDVANATVLVRYL